MKKQNITLSPLQDLNGRRLPIILHKLNTRKYSNLPLPSPSLQLPLSSKTSSSTRIHKTANNEHRRSKQNDIPRKPFSQKSKYFKSNTEPNCKSGQRSKLQSFRVSKTKINSKHSCSTSGDTPFDLFTDQSCTSPVGKNLTSGSCLGSFDSWIDDERDSSIQSVKTPPIESSLSPEIQRLSHSKILVLESATNTPTCYGTGHLVSGVITNKRKCRRRGSLNGGFEKVKLNDPVMINDDSHDYSIPLLAEASVRWDLSACDNHEQCEFSGADNVDSVGCTLENLALSRTKISWRDGILRSRFVDNEDDDNDDDVTTDMRSSLGKEKTSSNRCNTYPESICIEEDELTAYDDSD